VVTPVRPKHLKPSSAFPKIRKANNDVTSDIDATYNCIAFAAGVTNRKFWPGYHPDYYWPPTIPRLPNIDSFIKLYESYGYAQCADGAFRAGYEKVAIYATKDGSPQHAAKQIGPNRWASKLGDSYDIEHATAAVSGGMYGEMVAFLERPLRLAVGAATAGTALTIIPKP